MCVLGFFFQKLKNSSILKSGSIFLDQWWFWVQWVQLSWELSVLGLGRGQVLGSPWGMMVANFDFNLFLFYFILVVSIMFPSSSQKVPMVLLSSSYNFPMGSQSVPPKCDPRARIGRNIRNITTYLCWGHFGVKVSKRPPILKLRFRT